MLERVADREAGSYVMGHRGYSPSASTKADRILARAERNGAVPKAVKAFDNGDSRLNKLDMCAAVIGAIMTIGPLFAAFVGRLMPPA